MPTCRKLRQVEPEFEAILNSWPQTEKIGGGGGERGGGGGGRGGGKEKGEGR